MDADKTVIVTYKATSGGEHTHHSHGSEWKSDATSTGMNASAKISPRKRPIPSDG